MKPSVSLTEQLPPLAPANVDDWVGGAEARSYLQFVAQSHGDPRIKEEATAALKHLEQREQRRDASAE